MQQDLHGYRLLKAGNLSLLYDHGEIRQVRAGNIQVISAIYAAVRDRNWGTVPFELIHESIQEADGGVYLDAVLLYESREISYQAEIRIHVSSGQLSFSYSGKALSSFLRNRIGICVLHPPETCRGQSITVLHPDGSRSRGRFPEEISPEQPVRNMAGMQWKASGQLEAELRFEGEVFEMEDQRNWTDASYKTYGTPLNIPFPVQVHAGDEVGQSVQLNMAAARAHTHPGREAGARVILHPDRPGPLPALGVLIASESDPVNEKEAALLRRLHFHHMRSDLSPGDPAFKKEYERIRTEQDLLGWPVELGLHFRKHYREELEEFINLQAQNALKLESILVFNRTHMTHTRLLEQVLPRLREAIPQVSVGGGTNAYFAELNRSRPDLHELDFVSYSICPQVHAFDRLTLLENLEAQGDTVKSARQLFRKPVHIGAVSLKQRFNVVATDESDKSTTYPLADPLQGTAFAAGWTLGSIRRLSGAGAGSVNYYEAAGIRGLMDRQPDPGRIYPLYYALEEILRGHKHMLEISCSNPLSVEALAMQNDRETTLLMVNLTETEQYTDLEAPGARPTHWHILTASGWEEIPAPGIRGFHLKAASMYKIILRS